MSGLVVELLEMVGHARLRTFAEGQTGPLADDRSIRTQILELFLGGTPLVQCFLAGVVFRGEP